MLRNTLERAAYAKNDTLRKKKAAYNKIYRERQKMENLTEEKRPAFKDKIEADGKECKVCIRSKTCLIQEYCGEKDKKHFKHYLELYE